MRVRACALNHLDLWTRAGHARPDGAVPARARQRHRGRDRCAGRRRVEGLARRPARDALAGRVLRPLPDVPGRRRQLLPPVPHPRRPDPRRLRGARALPRGQRDPDPRRHRLRGGRGVPARVPHRLAHAGDAGRACGRAKTCSCGRRAAAWAWPRSRWRSTSARASSPPRARDGQAGAGARSSAPTRWSTTARRDVVAEVRRLTGKKGVDVVVEHVGQATLGALDPLPGPPAAGSSPAGPPPAAGATDLRHLFAKQLTLLGSYMGSKAELLDAAALFFARQAEAGRPRRAAARGGPPRARDARGVGALRQDRPARVRPHAPVPAPSLARRRPSADAARLLVAAARCAGRCPPKTWSSTPATACGCSCARAGRQSRARGPTLAPRAWPGRLRPVHLRHRHRRAGLGARLERRAHEHARRGRRPGASARGSTTPASTATCSRSAARWPRARPALAVAGFSLGANLVLLALGRSRRAPARRRLRGGRRVAAARPRGLRRRAGPRRSNRLYQAHFVRALRSAYRDRQRLLPDLYEAGRERGPRTIREFDDAITAHYGGFRDADDYYARSSAGPWLDAHRPPDADPGRRRRPHDPGGVGGALAAPGVGPRPPRDATRPAATSASWARRARPAGSGRRSA